MKICLAQMQSHPGDIAANADRHLQLIRLAAEQRADMIIFPELSLTSYEPTLANKLATTPEDKCFAAFREMSVAQNIIIGIGAPLQQAEGITIGLLLFHPDEKMIVYEKQYLHADEYPFFIPGKSNDGLIGDDTRIALAICYELSVPAHAKAALQNGAQVYLASVAKTAEGVTKAADRLAGLAREHAITTLLVNCVGPCDGVTCAGQSAVWNNRGELLSQLEENREGLLLLDTETNEVETIDC
ncbi:carbon-nitrogen hydrolase family protein [Flavisolibacter sp. BT320]|nr:carbon-nitrogen hydrolase family protein [Flavisolibacter longurius]